MTPKLDLACRLTVLLEPAHEIGETAAGRRRIIPIVGGRAEGPLLNADIVALGADWQTVTDARTAELDARYILRTDDGALIEIRNAGVRHGPEDVVAALGRGEDVPLDAYYMRTAARLTTGDPRYEWVNATIFVGSGGRRADRVEIDLYAVR